jgi:8-oxo-dGTP pyrophosphatase MutT (NUDIX family)
MPILVANTTIINQRGEILLVRRSANDEFMPGSWDLPGGVVEVREHPVDAAVRETKEEAGLLLANLKPLTIHSIWDAKKKQQFITIIFYTKKYRGRLKLNLNDHDDYIWVKPAKVKAMYGVPYLPQVVQALKGLKS